MLEQEQNQPQVDIIRADINHQADVHNKAAAFQSVINAAVQRVAQDFEA